MATRDSTDIQLEALSRRWQEDPSPHISLQLADLHRQRGDLTQAIAVLEKGLEAHSGHVSVQVALGRYRLEQGDAEHSAPVLREVVDKDPGHLVANKLLVRAHLALGDRKSAADRLELYAVLNDSDPELEELRSSVDRASPAGGVSPGPPPFPEAFGGAVPAAGTDLAALARPGQRSVMGALDRDPFTELRADPLRPAPLPGFLQQEAREEAEKPADEAVESETPGTERAAPTQLEAGAGATATLGALYLAQDHLTDAKRTFEQVLARDPGDSEAQAGLAEVERRSHPDQAVDVPVSAPHNAKITRLERYLSRIRAAAERLSA